MRLLLFIITLCTLPFLYAKTLTIGTISSNPPFETMADQKDHFFGFDIDIINSICQRLEVKCKYTPFIFKKLFKRLKEGKADLAIASIIISADRQKEFLFSLPYLVSNAQFITKRTSKIHTINDIRNKRVGVLRGMLFRRLVRKLYHDQVRAITYPTISSLFEELENNNIDIILLNDVVARYWYANNSQQYKLVGGKIPFGVGYGIMANKNQGALIAQVNKALLDMETDGTYLKIYSRYFGLAE